jgi:hypothetical protein
MPSGKAAPASKKKPTHDYRYEMKILDVIGNEGGSGSSNILTVRLANKPSQITARVLVEAAYIEEAQEKSWGSGYFYRLDRRPAHQGGDQLHIYRRNDAWAYRYTGTKSEPRKYTTPATNTVREIVRDVFKLDRSVKIESHVLSASDQEMVMELLFG